MNINNQIEPSLQKKILQNDAKFKLLLSKGLSSINKKEIPNNNKKNEDNFIKNMKKRMQFNEDKKEKNNLTSSIFHNDNLNNKIPIDNPKKTEKLNIKLNSKDTEDQISKNNTTYNEHFEVDIKKGKDKEKKENKKYNNDKITQNFLERQKNFIEKRNQKIKKEEEKLEEKLQMIPPTIKVSNKNNNKKNFKEYYNHFEEWEKMRKLRNEKKLEEKEELIKIMEQEFNHVPKIDEKSAKLAQKNILRKKEPNIFIRLSEQDKVIKAKKKILADMFKPTFQPMCYEPLNLNIKNIPKKNFFTENNINDNEELESDEKEENNFEEKEDEFDYQQDIMKFTDDNVDDALRGSLFHRKNKNK